LPENIGKYSYLIVQEISRTDRDPSNVLLAWIIAWAYAEPHELLAVQIKRTLKAELPNNFEKAYNKAMEMLNDPSFKSAAVKAFSMAISKYRVREDIKAMAYDAPTDRVLTGLQTIAQMMPGSSVLNRLINDIEYIQQMKTGVTPMPTVSPTQQSSQPTTQMSTQQPSVSQQQPSMAPQVQTVSQQPQPATAAPSAAGMRDMKDIIVDALNTVLKEKTEEILKAIDKLAGRIDEIEGFVNILRGKISDVVMHINELKEGIEGLKTKIGQPSLKKTYDVNADIIEAFKEVAKAIGLEITESEREGEVVPIEAPPKVGLPRPPSTPPPAEKIVEHIKTGPKVAPEKPKVFEVPEVPVPSIPAEVEVASKPQQQQEVELLISLLGDAEVLKRISDMLSDHKVGPFRWQLSLKTNGITFKITIQAAVRSLPRRYKKELVEKSKGMIIASTEKPLQEVMKVISALKNVRFIVWGDPSPPKEILNLGLTVEAGFLEDKESLLDILGRVLSKLANAL